MGYNTSSRILQFAANTFDVSIGDIFGALFYGGCVCVPSDDQRINDLSAIIRKMDVNQACLTPTIAQTLNRSEIPSLKTIALGGESLTRKDLEMWSQGVRLINIYGATEATIWCMASEVGKREDSTPSNIGKSFAGVTWVVDTFEHNRLASVGAVGELVIEGPLLARGYHNDSKKTAAAFIGNAAWAKHFKPDRRRQFFKTGDLVRYNLDSTLNFIGRKDTQVKLRGQRVELGEIEYYLMSTVPSDWQVAV